MAALVAKISKHENRSMFRNTVEFLDSEIEVKESAGNGALAFVCLRFFSNLSFSKSVLANPLSVNSWWPFR